MFVFDEVILKALAKGKYLYLKIKQFDSFTFRLRVSFDLIHSNRHYLLGLHFQLVCEFVINVNRKLLNNKQNNSKAKITFITE